MTFFQQAVDHFLDSEKEVAGDFRWEESAHPDEMVGFWLVRTATETGPHRLQVVARPFTPWKGYCIMTMFEWGGRLLPVLRLNHDTPLHEHVNHPPRPPGIPASVQGNRLYLWSDNRNTFTPHMLGLPYAQQLSDRAPGLHSAIRAVAGHSRITLAATPLPDYPNLNRLF